MQINKGSMIGLLCLAWAFGILFGLTIGINAPFILFLIATILYLFPLL